MDEIGESTIEIESSYSELEEDSVEWLIGELKSDGKQQQKEAQIRLEALFSSGQLMYFAICR